MRQFFLPLFCIIFSFTLSPVITADDQIPSALPAAFKKKPRRPAPPYNPGVCHISSGKKIERTHCDDGTVVEKEMFCMTISWGTPPLCNYDTTCDIIRDEKCPPPPEPIKEEF